MKSKRKKKPLHATVRKPVAPGRRVMRSAKAYDRKRDRDGYRMAGVFD